MKYEMQHGAHLTTEQLDELLAGGGRDDRAARHLRFCAVCAREVAGLRGAIGGLREGLTEMAARDRGSLRAARVERIRPVRRVPAYLALAASVAIVAVLVPLGRTVHPPVTTPDAGTVRSVAADEALLQEIDQQVSASVPAALEPLENPAGTDNANDTNTTKDRN